MKTFTKDFSSAPDIVAFAKSEDDVAAVFDWAAGARAAVIPFGGGTSVVGGVEPVVPARFAGTVSLDLTGLVLTKMDKLKKRERAFIVPTSITFDNEGGLGANYFVFGAPRKDKQPQQPREAVAIGREFSLLSALLNGATTVLDPGGGAGDYDDYVAAVTESLTEGEPSMSARARLA